MAFSLFVRRLLLAPSWVCSSAMCAPVLLQYLTASGRAGSNKQNTARQASFSDELEAVSRAEALTPLRRLADVM